MKKQIEIDFEPTPEEVAERFCEMEADEQAQFFNQIARLSDLWNRAFVFQLQGVADSSELTEAGRKVMCDIGQYS